ncbi:pentatricopeptide repeat-containing protein At1g80270, mitochondrial-like [Rutidosis leptorrhynchoides]|uniref:pentatricopeptide repeat-containing protein At1g80270, mitochondrial-like n=1 Tax=Rutidosis leptorrhynchoides TaxID=125765 RepID=UPI003A9A45F3
MTEPNPFSHNLLLPPSNDGDSLLFVSFARRQSGRFRRRQTPCHIPIDSSHHKDHEYKAVDNSKKLEEEVIRVEKRQRLNTIAFFFFHILFLSFNSREPLIGVYSIGSVSFTPHYFYLSFSSPHLARKGGSSFPKGEVSIVYQGLRIGIFRASSATSESVRGYLGGNSKSIVESPPVKCDRCLSYHAGNGCPKHGFSKCYLSSRAGANRSDDDCEDDDSEDDPFSELETAASSDSESRPVSKESGGKSVELDKSVSEPELSEGEDGDVGEPSEVDLDLLDGEPDSGNKKSHSKNEPSALFNAIVAAPGQSISGALNKWVEDGKDLGRDAIHGAMLNLRKRRMYGRALQLSEWLERNNRLDFVEKDYASRLDLIAKVHGLHKAESYIEKIPKSCRGEVIYRTLLANCSVTNNVKKAEEVFNKMRELGFPITTFACNQLLILYKRFDKKKIGDIMLLMEKEDVKRSLLTYRLLIDNRGQSNDISGMDEVYEIMKEEGIKPDTDIQAIMARHYITSGLKEKAEAILKEMEGGNLKAHRWACRALLPIYAELGKPDEVRRVWEVCESNPRLEECMAAIEAWGKLKDINEAEAVFNKMLNYWKRPSSKHYSALLKVYANHKMLNKGVELVKQMADKGCTIGPLIWDALVKLHVESGEVEKADSILQKATQNNHIKPMFTSYMAIMDQYSKRGDIHNSEKIFHRMRQAGYMARIRPFQALLNAYINAKAPAYGFRERMKAENVFPTKSVAADLAKVDAFRKTAVSDLLD